MLCCVAVARAEPASPSDADRLFEEGRALAKAGDYTAACERFAQSLELDHSLGTELNLADCHEKLGHLREAWRLFTAVAQESARSADTKRTEYARERVASISAKLATLVIKVERPVIGMSITVGDHSVEPSMEIIDLVEPGSIRITASVSRHPPFEKTIEGQAGVTTHVTIPPFEDAVGPVGRTEYLRRPSRVHLAIGLGIGAIAVGGAAVAFAFKGRSDYNATADGPHCERVTGGITCDALGTDMIHDAQRFANIGTIGAITAGALGVAAVIIYTTAPMDGVIVAPVATTERVGFVLSRSF